MKKLILLIAALLFVATPALAQKIGFVDLQKALNMSTAGQKAKDEISAKFKGYQDEINKRQDELKKLKEDLEKQAILLSEDARAQKERDFQRKVKDFQRFAKDVEEELQQKDAYHTRQILEELGGIIADLGKKGGYTMILEKTESSVLYGDASVDLTDQVIEVLNAKK
ncbi:MAG: hypothetical protein C0624_03025 [Desulfuromonas sp.]|nr:MAG: hypothetical protein C0624_03025 [Desulfuromonas sp.]